LADATMRRMAEGQADSLVAEIERYYGSEAVPQPSPVVSKTGEPPPPAVQSPPNNSLPEGIYADRYAIVIALRAEGYTHKEIAEKTGLSIWQIQTACHKARQSGQMRDALDMIDNSALPQAVDNLLEGLRKGDKEYTLEVLKGRGAFRKFSDKPGAGVGALSLPPLQINILTPAGGNVPTVIINSEKGAVIGTPRDDAEE
jgi:hypothetical protein